MTVPLVSASSSSSEGAKSWSTFARKSSVILFGGVMGKGSKGSTAERDAKFKSIILCVWFSWWIEVCLFPGGHLWMSIDL